MSKIDDLKAQINALQEELASCENPYKVGVWYKCPSKGQAMFRVVKTNEHTTVGYGLNFAGEWVHSEDWGTPRHVDTIEATDKEVKAMLFKEAKRRGFKEGAFHNTYDRMSSLYSCKGALKMGWADDPYSLHFEAGSGLIFLDGEWAHIVPEDRPIINGYVLEIGRDEINFGCARFHKKQLLKLYEEIKEFNRGKSNRSIKSFMVNSGVSITLDELEKVVEFLNKVK